MLSKFISVKVVIIFALYFSVLYLDDEESMVVCDFERVGGGQHERCLQTSEAGFGCRQVLCLAEWATIARGRRNDPHQGQRLL